MSPETWHFRLSNEKQTRCATVPDILYFNNFTLKVTISLIVIGLKNSYFPLIHLPSCYGTVCHRTACYWIDCHRTVQ